MRRKTRADDREPRAPAGFTLLEVLAAVLIFAVAFTTLAGHTMSWVRAEGITTRRLQASLLADDQMADLEARVALGDTPPLGEEETEQGDFRLTVSVEPWQPPFSVEDPNASDSRAGAAVSLFRPGKDDPNGVLRQIRVVVRWDEGFEEHAVNRTTFAVDAEAARQLLEGAGFAPPGSAADGTGSGTDTGTGNDTSGRRGARASGGTEP